MILNEDQLLILSSLNKINISKEQSNEEEKEKYYNNIVQFYSDILLSSDKKNEKMINYFTELKLKTKNLSKYDEYLYSKLEDYIKNEIEEKVRELESIGLMQDSVAERVEGHEVHEGVENINEIPEFGEQQLKNGR